MEMQRVRIAIWVQNTIIHVVKTKVVSQMEAVSWSVIAGS